MKRIITFFLLLATTTLSAKVVVKNPATDLVLSETAGIYSITGHKGTVITGNQQQTKEFLESAMEALLDESVNNLLGAGSDVWNVGKDDAGLYIIKVGAGAVKLRKSDIIVFESALGLKYTAQFTKEVCNEGKERLKKIRTALKDN